MAEEKIQLSRSRMRKKILSVVFLLILNSILLIPYSVSAGTLNKPSNLLVLNTGLVGWWTMDGKNTINNISDSSGQGNTGYLFGQISTTTSLGKIGQAVNFDGVDDYVSVSSGSMLVTSDDWTASTWIRSTGNAGNYRVAFANGDAVGGGGGRAGFQMGITSSQKFFVATIVGADSEEETLSLSSASLDTWYHLVVRKSGTDSSVYVNGVLDKSATLSSATMDNTGNDLNTLIGVASGNSDPWNGSIDDVRIYNRVLTSTEIRQLYNMGAASKSNISPTASSTPTTSGLTGYWKMDNQNLISNVADSSGQGNTGYLVLGAGGTTATTTVTGRPGQALSFDGNDDEVRISGPALTGAHSVSMWIYPTADPSGCASNACALFALRNTAGFVWVDSNQIGYFGNFVTDAISGSLSLNTWYHIVATVDSGGNSTLYINNAIVDTGTNFPAYTPDVIGGDDVNNQTFTGSIDEVRVYNRVLSAAEIRGLYAYGAFGHSSNLSQKPLTNGLVGYWTFDGKDTDWSTRTFNDVSGNNNLGTTTTLTQSSAVLGKIGQAMNFDGADDYVDAGTISSLAGVNKATISSWAYRSSASNIISLGESPTTNARYRFGYQWYSDDNIYCVAENGTLAYNHVAGHAETGWHHILVAYDGTLSNNDRCQIYFDGVLQTMTSDGHTLATSLASGGDQYPFEIGRQYADPEAYSTGRIDDVRVYNRALSSTEIRQLYNMGATTKVNASPVVTSGIGLNRGLVGYWTFDGKNMIQNVADSSGQGNTGYLLDQISTTTVVGKIGQAVLFDDATYVTADDSTSLDITGTITMVAWIKPTSSHQGQVITKYNLQSVNMPWDIQVWDDNLIYTAVKTNNGFVEVPSSGAITYGQWLHVVTVYDGTNIILYLNGVEDNSLPQTGTIETNDFDLEIGGASGNGTDFIGSLDDVRIYNRALSATEILQLYNLVR